MINKISILGSTGSIGKQALDVAQNLGIEVCALTAYSNISLLEEQVRKFRPKIVAVYKKDSAEKLKNNIKDLDVTVLYGEEGVCEVASFSESDIVLNSVVGIAGLKPTLCAINAKKNIALANKETLVTGGSLVIEEAKKNDVKILPVDSEHSAIFQCLQGLPNKKALKKIILTASGGPFFNKSLDGLRNVTLEQALNHPNWSMGKKITIDSATMMNKGLEIIEAVWLFDVMQSDIDVVIHRESIVHSMIQCIDNSVIAQLGLPDMKIPIQYALTYPERYPCNVGQLDLTDITSLSFYKPDENTFKCLAACKKAINIGGTLPAAVNGANEEAVKLFLKKQISFTDIGELVSDVANSHTAGTIKTVDDIINADKKSREYIINMICKN